jgi:hypothetical protein
VRVPVAVAEQLRLLHDDPDRGDAFAAALGRLGRDVRLAVPSTLAVTIALGRTEVGVSATEPATEPAPVLASLAVPLSGRPGGGRLILRAAAAGAYLLLADDLGGLLGPGHPPIETDRHLSWPAPGRAGSVADRGAVDRAVGVLVDRGLPPAAARRELRRRAAAAGSTVAAVSRDLLAALAAGPDPG